MSVFKNITAKVFQNKREVMILKDVSIIIHHAPLYPAPLVQPLDTCEVFGIIVENKGIRRNTIMNIQFETQDGTKLEGDFYIKLPSTFNENDKVYFDLSGPLTIKL